MSLIYFVYLILTCEQEYFGQFYFVPPAAVFLNLVYLLKISLTSWSIPQAYWASDNFKGVMHWL